MFWQICYHNETLRIAGEIAERVVLHNMGPHHAPGGLLANLGVALKRTFGNVQIPHEFWCEAKNLANGLRSLHKKLLVARALLTAVKLLGTLELGTGGRLETQRSHNPIFPHMDFMVSSHKVKISSPSGVRVM